mmetsp:Transcript_118547/g.335368  ORF Transcript_118547/g.335368 Transcript_118547/m.335368 type:complete len:356 (-) Transcript_118547:121-1188(-)
MGSLRRKVSVMDVGVHSAAPLVPPELAEVACEDCTLSFTNGGPQLPGLASLVIRIGRSEHSPSHKAPGCDRFRDAVDRVLGARRDFVLTWDFRGMSPSRSLSKVLANFSGDRRARLSERAKSAAMLVQDNIFTAATLGVVGSFVEACIPGCPFLVCHGEAAAEEFFRTSAGFCAAACPAFVSVTDVRSARNDASGFTQSCVASLAPLVSKSTTAEGRPKKCAEAQPTFHVMPNGDLRVIQSPPPDIVFGRPLEDPVSAGVGPTEQRVPRPLPSGISDCDLAGVAALMFKGHLETLRHLIGAHFHVRELVIDAEMESIGMSQQSCKSSPDGAASQCGCFVGVQALLHSVLNRTLDV